MNETVCDAYSNLGPAAMENFLYGSEGLPYNSDHQLDAFIYCVALRCSELYCSGIGL
jgi:hypothetical protein